MSTTLLSNSSIYGSSSTETTTSSGSDRLAADKNTFLKLLVAQLTNQDPLNPTEDKEFITQLAQFTSLEQLQSINEGVETLNETMQQGQMISATSFIGKDVVVTGDQVTKMNSDDGSILTTTIYFTIDEAMAKGQVNIYDQTSGNLVYSEDLAAKQAGTYSYVWDGLNSSGKEVASGVYKIVITAQDSSDKAVLVSTLFTDRVSTVLNEDGVYKLTLASGRVVNLTDVTEVGGGTSTTSVSSYATYTADYAAAASIARDSAASYLEKVNSATTADNAKTYANSAISQASTARTAADNAETLAAEARTYAEEAKTNAALEDAEKAQEWADKAAQYATEAEDYADQAKTAAIGMGASWD